MILTRTCITDLFLAKPSSDTSVQALSPRRGAGAARPLGDSVNALGLCFLSLKNSPTGGASCRVSRCASTGSSCLHPCACLAGWRQWTVPSGFSCSSSQRGSREVGRKEKSGYPSVPLPLPSTHCKQSPPSPCLGIPPCLSSVNFSLPNPSGSPAPATALPPTSCSHL